MLQRMVEFAGTNKARAAFPDSTTTTQEETMITRLFLASTALLALAIVPASAGPCTEQIASLSKTMSTRDAGAGPTAGASASVTAPPASATGTPATTTGQASSQPAQPGQHPPTAVMGKATEGQATSAEDARRQTQGQPTAADQAAGAQASGSNKVALASAALDRARAADARGQEAQCMQSIEEARSNLGQ
jgi:hypothetical protein